MVIQLANDVLFDSGHTRDQAGRASRRSAQVASVFQTIGDRKFQVAGDTDNVPIHNDAVRLELGAVHARARSRSCASSSRRGCGPSSLSAAGYGEFDPVAPNEDAGGRAKNRRIEITLQPNIDELVSMPPG